MSPEIAARVINQEFKINLLNNKIKDAEAASTSLQASNINKTFKNRQLEEAKNDAEVLLEETRQAYADALVNSHESRLNAVKAVEGPLKARNAELEAELAATRETSKAVQAELRAAFVEVVQSAAGKVAASEGTVAELKKGLEAKDRRISDLETAMSSYMASAHEAKLRAQEQARAEAKVAAAAAAAAVTEAAQEAAEEAAKRGAATHAAEAINAAAAANAKVAELQAKLNALEAEREEFMAEREVEAEIQFGDRADYRGTPGKKRKSSREKKKKTS